MWLIPHAFLRNSDFIVNIEILFQGKIDYYSMGSQNPILEKVTVGRFLQGKISILPAGEIWQVSIADF